MPVEYRMLHCELPPIGHVMPAESGEAATEKSRKPFTPAFSTIVNGWHVLAKLHGPTEERRWRPFSACCGRRAARDQIRCLRLVLCRITGQIDNFECLSKQRNRFAQANPSGIVERRASYDILGEQHESLASLLTAESNIVVHLTYPFDLRRTMRPSIHQLAHSLGSRRNAVAFRPCIDVRDEFRSISVTGNSPCTRGLTFRAKSGCEQSQQTQPYSITSSAVICMISGTVRPSALAVLRLMIISIFVDCWTGRSAGFSPLSIRLV